MDFSTPVNQPNDPYRSAFLGMITRNWGASVIDTFNWANKEIEYLVQAAIFSDTVPLWDQAIKILNQRAWVRCLSQNTTGQVAGADSPEWQREDFEYLLKGSNWKQYGTYNVDFKNNPGFSLGEHGELIKRADMNSRHNHQHSPLDHSEISVMEAGSHFTTPSSSDHAPGKSHDAEGGAENLMQRKISWSSERFIDSEGARLPERALGSRNGSDHQSSSTDNNHGDRYGTAVAASAVSAASFLTSNAANTSKSVEASPKTGSTSSLEKSISHLQSYNSCQNQVDLPSREPDTEPINEQDRKTSQNTSSNLSYGWDWSKVPKGPKWPSGYQKTPEDIRKMPYIFVSTAKIPADESVESRLKDLTARWEPIIRQEKEGFYILFNRNLRRQSDTQILNDLGDCYANCNGAPLVRGYPLRMEITPKKDFNERKRFTRLSFSQAPEKEDIRNTSRTAGRDPKMGSATERMAVYLVSTDSSREQENIHKRKASDDIGVARVSTKAEKLSQLINNVDNSDVGGKMISTKVLSKEDPGRVTAMSGTGERTYGNVSDLPAVNRLSAKFSRAPPSPPRTVAAEVTEKNNVNNVQTSKRAYTEPCRTLTQLLAIRSDSTTPTRPDFRRLSNLRQRADDELSISSGIATSEASSSSSRKDPYCRKCPKERASFSPLHDPLVKCSACPRYFHEGCAEPRISSKSERSDWRCRRCVKQSRPSLQAVSTPSMLSKHVDAADSISSSPLTRIKTNAVPPPDQTERPADKANNTILESFLQKAAELIESEERGLESVPMDISDGDAMDVDDEVEAPELPRSRHASPVTINDGARASEELKTICDSELRSSTVPERTHFDTTERAKIPKIPEIPESRAVSVTADFSSDLSSPPASDNEKHKTARNTIASPAVQAARLLTVFKSNSRHVDDCGTSNKTSDFGKKSLEKSVYEDLNSDFFNPSANQLASNLEKPKNSNDKGIRRSSSISSTVISSMSRGAVTSVTEITDSDRQLREQSLAVATKKRYVMRELCGMAMINLPGNRASNRNITTWVKQNVPGYSDEEKAWQAENGCLKWATNVSAILAQTKCFKTSADRDDLGHVIYLFANGAEKDFLHFRQTNNSCNNNRRNDNTTAYNGNEKIYAELSDHIMVSPPKILGPKKLNLIIRDTRRSSSAGQVSSTQPTLTAKPTKLKLRVGSVNQQPDSSTEINLVRDKITPPIINSGGVEHKTAARKSHSGFSWSKRHIESGRNSNEYTRPDLSAGVANRPRRIADSSTEQSDIDKSWSAVAKPNTLEQNGSGLDLSPNPTSRRRTERKQTEARKSTPLSDWRAQMNANRMVQDNLPPKLEPQWYTDKQACSFGGGQTSIAEEDFIVKDLFEAYPQYRPDYQMAQEAQTAQKIEEIHARPSRKQTMKNNVASRIALGRDRETGNVHRLVARKKRVPVSTMDSSSAMTAEHQATRERHQSWVNKQMTEWFPNGWIQVDSMEELYGLPKGTQAQLSCLKGDIGHTYVVPSQTGEGVPTIDFHRVR